MSRTDTLTRPTTQAPAQSDRPTQGSTWMRGWTYHPVRNPQAHWHVMR